MGHSLDLSLHSWGVTVLSLGGSRYSSSGPSIGLHPGGIGLAFFVPPCGHVAPASDTVRIVGTTINNCRPTNSFVLCYVLQDQGAATVTQELHLIVVVK